MASAILFLLAFISAPSDPVQVLLEGSPPIPALYQLDMDSVTISDSSISALQQNLLQWYLEEGYPFASAGFFFPSADTLAVNVVPGRHAALEEVRIEGMPGTRTSVFTRLLPMKPGESYSREAVERWIERLSRLSFVESVGSTELLLGQGGNLVLVQQLQKGSAGYFSASMDWKGDYLEGMGEILFLNLAGTARELEISGQSTEWGGLNAYLRYREPWLFGIPLSLQLELSQDTPESAWVNREGNIIAIWSMDRTELRAGAGMWRGYPPESDTQEYDFGLAGITYRGGTRTRQGWSGIELDLEARSGNRAAEDSSGLLTMAELTLQLDAYKGLFGFGGRALAGGVMQGQWFEGLLRQLGGQPTLRGYPENSFRAVRYAVARPEVSLGETETRIYVFTDMAAILTQDDIMRYPVGSGIGIRGYSGIFRADAAAGFPLSEGLGSARIYLRLTASL